MSDDLPDDFFDDFGKDEFLGGIAVSEVPAEDESPADDAAQGTEERENEQKMLKEIERLRRDIEARKRKIESIQRRSKSKSRSPDAKSRRRSSSRSRRRSRSRGRSRSRERRRGGRHRSRSRSRERDPRKIRSRSRQNSTGRSITFLEELAQKFAEQGKAFPEGEEFARLKSQGGMPPIPPQGVQVYPMQTMGMHGGPMGGPMPPGGPMGGPMPPGGPMGGPMMSGGPMMPGGPMGPMGMPPHGMMFPNPIAMGMEMSMPQPPPPMEFMNQPGPSGMNQPFPCPPVAIGYPANLYAVPAVQPKTEKVSAPPAPSVSMDLEEYSSAADDIFRKASKEQVIARCKDVIHALRENKSGILSKRFLYTPTVLSVEIDKHKFETPLKGPNNVDFKLTSRNFDESKLPLKKLSPLLSEIVTILGFPAECLSPTFVRPPTRSPLAKLKAAVEVKSPAKSPAVSGGGGGGSSSSGGSTVNGSASVLSRLASRLGPKVQEALPRDMKESVSTQTDENYCEKCIKLSLKLFKDVPTQTIRIENKSIGCQASGEDAFQSLAELTPKQLVGINDFSKILRSTLIPTNYREATELRDRLYNIYQTCTGIGSNLFPRDVDDRMDRDMRSELQSSSGGRNMGGGNAGGGGGNEVGGGRSGWRVDDSRSQIPGSSLPYEPFTGVQDPRSSGARGATNQVFNKLFNDGPMGVIGGGAGPGPGAGGSGGYQDSFSNGMMTSKQIMEMEQQRRNQQMNFNRMDPRFGASGSGTSGGAGGQYNQNNFNNNGRFFN